MGNKWCIFTCGLTQLGLILFVSLQLINVCLDSASMIEVSSRIWGDVHTITKHIQAWGWNILSEVFVTAGRHFTHKCLQHVRQRTVEKSRRVWEEVLQIDRENHTGGLICFVSQSAHDMVMVWPFSGWQCFDLTFQFSLAWTSAEVIPKRARSNPFEEQKWSQDEIGQLKMHQTVFY